MVLQAAPPRLSASEVAELQPVLLAYALRATGDAEAARDLVQETLLAAVAGRGDFQGRAALRTWCIGILTHKVLDLFRSRQRARARAADDTCPDDLAEPTAGRPDRRVAHRQALAILESSLIELPELERLAVLLIDVEGFERDEACDKLGITTSHLRVLLHRGRHRLRRALEKAGVSDGE